MVLVLRELKNIEIQEISKKTQRFCKQLEVGCNKDSTQKRQSKAPRATRAAAQKQRALQYVFDFGPVADMGILNPWDPWGPVGTRGDPWVPVGTRGDPWGPLGTRGDP